MIKHEGVVPWWRYRNKKETLGIERWCPPDVEDGESSSRLPTTRGNISGYINLCTTNLG